MSTAQTRERIATDLVPELVNGSPRGGWDLLLSPLPDEALTPLDKAVYGASGLSDINEAFLLERLHRCGLDWSLTTPAFEVLSSGDVLCHLDLAIDGKLFHGVGGHKGRRPDVSYKGAYTQAFKNACKWAGLTLSVYGAGKAKDDVQDASDQAPRAAVNPVAALTQPAAGAVIPSTQQTLMRELKEHFGDDTAAASAWCLEHGTEFRKSVLLDLPTSTATDLLNALSRTPK